MRDYGKVHTSFWASSNIRSMSEDGRALAMYLLTCPHGTIAGAFRLPDGYACEDLQWSTERVKEAFAELLGNGFANRCETTKWVWVVKHLEWNPPENPNQRKSAAKVAAQVPDECAWKREFMRVCGDSLGLKPFEESNGSGTVAEPFANQEQEQEQEVNTGALAPVASLAAADPCPHQEIIAAYHELLPTCTAVKVWNDYRKGLLRQRWREDVKRQRIEWWRKFFAYIAKSKFLTGAAETTQGREPFVADLEWLVRPQNFANVIEGKYHRDEVAA